MNGLSPETLNVSHTVFSRCGPCCCPAQSRSHANVTLSLIEDPRRTHITCYCYGCNVFAGILSFPSIIQMIGRDDMYSDGCVALKGNVFFKSAGQRTRTHMLWNNLKILKFVTLQIHPASRPNWSMNRRRIKRRKTMRRKKRWRLIMVSRTTTVLLLPQVPPPLTVMAPPIPCLPFTVHLLLLHIIDLGV